ncbi:MAG: hypothetical protein ACRC76_00405 [Proteocatella sp.]
MTDVKVNVALESLALTNRKAITGEIYFENMDGDFPERHWIDFVVVILNWWFEAIDRVKKATIGESDEFLFMDGPYLVRGCKIDQNIMRMDFIKSQLKGERSFSSMNCDVNSFGESLLITAKRVVVEINKRKWEVNELDKLSSAIERYASS